MKRVLRLIPTLLLAAVFMLLFASQTACDGSIAPLRLSSLQTAAARTLYVATTGHDADPGTLSQPWHTIQHAADAVQPGDTVFVRSGTYAESVTVARSGAQNNPITFSAYSGEAVTLDGSGSEWAGFIVDQGVSNVVLDGFAVRNYSEVSVDVRGTNSYITLSNLDLSGASGGVRITWGYSGEAPMYGPADHITIRDSRIHDNHLSGIDATPGPATDLVFQRLTVENNGVGVQSFGADGIAVERGYPVLVEDVTIRNNGGDGLDLNSRDWSGNASGVVVRRNKLIGNHLQAIKLWAGGRMENNIVWGQGINPVIVGVFTSTVEVVNNTIAYNMYDPAFSARDYAFVAAYPEIGFSPPVALTLVNNVFAFNTGPDVGTPTGLYLGAGVSLTERNNLYFSRDDGEIEAEFITGRDPFFTRAEIADGTWTAATGQGQGDIILDPLFTSGWPAVDLHLRSGSPAIDSGTSTQAPPVDLDGNSRPQGGGYDIGAYEWTEVPPPSIQAYLPIILDNAYGGWSTGVNIRNPSTSAVTVQIVYHSGNGNVAGTDSKTVAANGYWGVTQAGRLGGNWAGSGVVFSTAPVVAVVHQVGPGDRAMGYSAVITPATTLYLPVVFDNAYGGWTSGINVTNTSGSPASLRVSYYDSSGRLASADSGTLQAQGCWGVYQGGRLGPGFAGSAVITATQPVVAVVNEIQAAGSAISYRGFNAGGSVVNLPVVLNNAYGGWTTGVGIQNTSTSAAAGTITYYDNNGTSQGTSVISLLGRGYVGLYHGSAGLPDGFAGSAVIRMNRPVVAVVHEVPISGDAMGYAGVVAGGSEVELPLVMDNGYGGWNSGAGIQNVEASNKSVTVQYYDASGASLGSASQNIPAWGYWGLYQGGALGGRVGSARILANGPLAVIVNEIGPGSSAISYSGTP